MKRIVMLVTLLVLVVGMAATAAASDLRASGHFRVEALWNDNNDFMSTGDFDAANRALNQNDEEDFDIQERFRAAFEFIANENLRGVFQIEAGTQNWGRGAFEQQASAVGIEIRQAYVDFNWPNTNVNIRAGFMATALPAAVGGGNFALDNRMAGLQISVPITDNVGLLVGYARPYDPVEKTGHDDVDLGYLALPLTFDGVLDVTPYFAYGQVGSQFVEEALAGNVGTIPVGLLNPIGTNNLDGNATYGTEPQDLYYAGLAYNIEILDPFLIHGDVMWGGIYGGQRNTKKSGWMADLSLEYTGWDFVTPELFFAYTSGEDGNFTNSSSERMPILAADNWAVGSYFFGGSWWNNDLGAGNPATVGFWTIGLSMKDFSFVEDLTHTFTVLFAQGTNDEEIVTRTALANNAALPYTNWVQYGRTLTTEDNIWEFDLNTQYAIYDELTAHLDIGYIIANFDDSVWDNHPALNAADDHDGANAFKIGLGLGYEF